MFYRLERLILFLPDAHNFENFYAQSVDFVSGQIDKEGLFENTGGPRNPPERNLGKHLVFF